MSVDEAVSTIPDDSRIFVSAGSSVPLTILEAMAERRDRWTAIEVVSDYLVAPLPLFAYPNAPFRITSLQPSGALKSMIDAGAYTSAASALSTWGNQISPGGALALDVAIIHVSPAGPDGRLSLGVNTVTTLDAMASADLVIAQVNPRMPYTYGASQLERDEIDILVDADHALVEFPAVNADATTKVVGQLVADQITDDSWLQLGLGALPDVVCAALAGHKRLGIHSGMIADGVIDLFASGALTGDAHPEFPGKIVTAGVYGTRRSFEWAHQNPNLVMAPPTVTHGLEAIAPLPNFCAINSSIEVALDGSINSERIGERVVSGPGGAPDYGEIMAATPSARFFVALPSTAARGTRSRIVSELQAPATVPGHHVDLVITEHGVANIADVTGSERAAALAAVAHPDFNPLL